MSAAQDIAEVDAMMTSILPERIAARIEVCKAIRAASLHDHSGEVTAATARPHITTEGLAQSIGGTFAALHTKGILSRVPGKFALSANAKGRNRNRPMPVWRADLHALNGYIRDLETGRAF